MPMMTDAANEQIVRREMIAVLSRLPKNVCLEPADQTIWEQVSPGEPQLATIALLPVPLLD